MRDAKISPERLGLATGVSPRLIRKYRAGTTVPRDSYGDPTANAHKLADYLEVDVGWLLDTEPDGVAA